MMWFTDVMVTQDFGIHYNLFQYHSKKMLNHIFSQRPKIFIFIIWQQSFFFTLRDLTMLTEEAYYVLSVRNKDAMMFKVWQIAFQ